MLKPLEIGTTFLQKYRVVRLIEHGELDDLHAVERIGETVGLVLKRIDRESCATPDGRKAFSAACAQVPVAAGVVPILDSGVDDRAAWIVMPLLDGEDLERRTSRAPLDERELRQFCREVSEALGRLHGAGVRDGWLTPRRLVEASNGRPAWNLLCAGIASASDTPETRKQVRALPSPLFLDPELTRSDGVRPTPSADIWSLGLIAFYAATGKHFWRTAGTDGVAALYREILMEPIPTAKQRASELGSATSIPDWFDAWFARCVVRDPSRRFADANEAALAVEPSADLEVSATPPVLVPTSTPQLLDRATALRRYEQARERARVPIADSIAAIVSAVPNARRSSERAVAVGDHVTAEVSERAVAVKARGVRWDLAGHRSDDVRSLATVLSSLAAACEKMVRSATAARLALWARPSPALRSLASGGALVASGGALEIVRTSWTWTGPHTGQERRTVVASFPWGMFSPDAPTLRSTLQDLESAADAAASMERSTCAICGSATEPWHMFDDRACESCANTYLGIIR